MTTVGTKPGRENYSESELEAFEATKLQPYLKDDKYLSYEAEVNFMQSQGVVEIYPKKPEIKTATDAYIMVVAGEAQEYSRLSNKISQWKQWRKFEDEPNSRSEDLQKMAEIASEVN